jgi:hypothetical protein
MTENEIDNAVISEVMFRKATLHLQVQMVDMLHEIFHKLREINNNVLYIADED